MKNWKYLSLALSCCMWLSASADNWMSRLSDDTYVMQMSIPGTHDAATGEGFTWGEFADAFGRTQDLTLADQWAAGVRAFDLRPAVSTDDDGQDNLVIYHGILETNIRFADALQLLCDSLNANPSETAIVIMRFENDNGGSRTTWNQLMSELLNSDGMKERIVDFKPRLTLGEMRGKLLVASRDNYASTPVGAFITGWSHDAGFDKQKNGRIKGITNSSTLYVQDFYELTEAAALDKKVNALKTMLDFTVTLHKRKQLNNVWIVNHCSGYTQSASIEGIRECAATTNKYVADYLADESHWGPTGIVMMDFAGTDRSGDSDVMGQALVNAIIENNFRYEPKTSGIENIVTTHSHQAYNLQGQALPYPSNCRGIIIKDGKKLLTE